LSSISIQKFGVYKYMSALIKDSETLTKDLQGLATSLIFCKCFSIRCPFYASKHIAEAP